MSNPSSIAIPDAQWDWPIYLQNWVVLGVNVGKYTIHWASGNRPYNVWVYPTWPNLLKYTIPIEHLEIGKLDFCQPQKTLSDPPRIGILRFNVSPTSQHHNSSGGPKKNHHPSDTIYFNHYIYKLISSLGIQTHTKSSNKKNFREFFSHHL